MLSFGEGEVAVRLARNAIEECLNNRVKVSPRGLPLVFEEKRGVFVTLNEGEMLRGCIGRPYPVLPLGEAIIVSAINAARDDPRFPPVKAGELELILVEVTVLTLPERLKARPEELPDKIVVGKHGLIVRKGYYQGLLLPQVAVEHGFDGEEFLCQTCMKAGLYPDGWLNGAEVYCFEGQIFEEISPKGEVREKKLECE